jgi:DNA ligase D-like protein (predicted ligase)
LFMPRISKRSAAQAAKTSAPLRRGGPVVAPPAWIEPQLCLLVERAPSGPQWVHEIKLDGFRMAARVERGRVQFLTRTGLDWSHKYPSLVAALAKLPAAAAYIDGELCGIGNDGLPSFSQTQAASDGSSTVQLVYYSFDLLHLDGRNISSLPLGDRKALLQPLLSDMPGCQYHGHEVGDGEHIRKHACGLGLEGIVSKQIDRPYASLNRGIWQKSKCLNRQEFVIVGWTDPEGARPHLGALLLGYYSDDGLKYAGRVGTGMPDKVLADLRRRLEPLARDTMPLAVPPPRKTRFGSPMVLSRVHWVDPKLVAEITYLTWTGDRLLRHTVFVGLRSDKPAKQVRLEIPGMKSQK